MGSVEPLPVLLAKVDKQMGDKRLLLPFPAQTRIIGSVHICKPKGLDLNCSYIITKSSYIYCKLQESISKFGLIISMGIDLVRS